MRMYDIICKKRQGKELSKEEIEFVVNSFTTGTIPDSQMSALLMAICLLKLTKEETMILTTAMANSGEVVDLSGFGDKTVDKHSTGGVGDKTTLIVASIVAACGGVVAKMSGRGLGHTGGTIDKLESIKGFSSELSQKDFIRALKQNSIAIISQSGNLAPADKKMYALRDLTATVENSSLIASSVMSKKIAAGAKNIVLDVKCGSGAFMKNPDDAFALAADMVEIGKKSNRNVCAVISNMNSPLGNNIGNSLEVIEAIEILKNHTESDLAKLSIILATKMIELSLHLSEKDAESKVLNSIENGKAFEKFKEMVAFQGGDTSYIDDTEKFEKSKFVGDVVAMQDGFLNSINALEIGTASVMLGAGRTNKNEKIDFSAGVILLKKVGEKICCGEKLATLYSNKNILEECNTIVKNAFETTETQVQPEPLILKIIQ